MKENQLAGEVGKNRIKEILSLRSKNAYLKINGKKITWESISSAESEKMSVYSGVGGHSNLWSPLGDRLTDRAVNIDTFGIKITHDSDQISSPIIFVPANYKNWFDEFEKKGIAIKDNFNIRSAKNYELNSLKIFWWGVFIFGLTLCTIFFLIISLSQNVPQ